MDKDEEVKGYNRGIKTGLWNIEWFCPWYAFVSGTLTFATCE